MNLSADEKHMLQGRHGRTIQKSMEILVALGEIFEADRLIPVKSAQISGVSYHNIGDAGLEFLQEMASGDKRVRVPASLNPAGMDLEDWTSIGIGEIFASKQKGIIDAYVRMGVTPSCTCTPYLFNLRPSFGDHLAWSESSAVAYANSIIGARTNKEGGPSALAAALTGRTPNYGLHLDRNRAAQIIIRVEARLDEPSAYGALGYAIATRIGSKIPCFTGICTPTSSDMRSLSASIATYGGTSLFHIEGVTPNPISAPLQELTVNESDLEKARAELNDSSSSIDFVAIGCPHASFEEIADIAKLLKGKRVKAEMWITTSKEVKRKVESDGLLNPLREAGVKIVADTCMAVAPLRGRFLTMATNSAKACYYARASNSFKTKFGTLQACIDAAVSGKWSG